MSTSGRSLTTVYPNRGTCSGQENALASLESIALSDRSLVRAVA